MKDDFLVLGDLGDNRYVTRMFVGEKTYDEVLSVPIDKLRDTVTKRLQELSVTPDPELESGAPRPAVDPGHAVAL